MGREIRKVPPNWMTPETERPNGRMGKQPMYDEPFEKCLTGWLAELDRIRAGKLTDFEKECYPLGLGDWLQDEGLPPDPKYYRPWKDEEATWLQVWETVSEGTPVSPAFKTADELIDYLAENGDFWDQDRCHKPDWASLWGGVPHVSGWGKERAVAFVNSGWACSFIVTDGKVLDGKFAAHELNEQ